MPRSRVPFVRTAAAAAASLLLASTPLRAGTLTVPGSSATLQGAIALAADGDTILVAPGACVETIDLLGRRLDIEGSGGAAHTILDGDAMGRTVTLDSGEPAGTRADMGAIPFENAFDDLGGGVPLAAGPVVLAAHSTLVGGDGVVFKPSGTVP